MLSSKNRVSRSAAPVGRGAPRVKQPRSEKQREAARRNGSKGRGPITAEGKARSRLNSMKHGLLARHLTPPSDPRGDDGLYLRTHAELLAEFSPDGLADRVKVDRLASEIVQLSRVHRMREALMRPQVARGVAEQADRLTRARRNAEALRACHAALADNGLPGPPASDADANRTAELLRAALADLEVPDEVDDDVLDSLDEIERDEQAKAGTAAAMGEVRADRRGGPSGAEQAAAAGTPGAGPAPAGPRPYVYTPSAADLEFERSEREKWSRLKAVLNPVQPLMWAAGGRAQEVVLLSGRADLAAGERAVWTAAVGALADRAEAGLAVHRESEAAYANAADAHLLALANNPDALTKIEKYGRKIERSVDRMIRELGRR